MDQLWVRHDIDNIHQQCYCIGQQLPQHKNFIINCGNAVTKFRYPLILFVAGTIFLVIGMMLRIMHWPGGRLITGSMMMVQGFAIVWLIVLLFRSDKKL